MPGPMLPSECCGTCHFRLEVSSGKDMRIACRLNPPVPFAFNMGVTPEGHPRIHQTMMLPVVQPRDWCGQWKAESKIIPAQTMP